MTGEIHPLIVDVSPMAVNRTAMYSVVRDSVRYLMTHAEVAAITAVGRGVELLPFVANDFKLTLPARDELGERIEQLLQRKATVARSHGDATWVVFDPLYVLTLPSDAKAVVMVLDLTPLTRPDWHRTEVVDAYQRAALRLRDERFTLIAISESTRRDLWAHLAIPPSRVEVVPLYDPLTLGVDRSPTKTLLFVGSLETRKNVSGLIKGFALSGLYDEGYRLHVVGANAHGYEVIRATGDAVPGVIFRGRLNDEELASEYAQAAGLAYPSYWEGFGLPALEAQALGMPVLLSCSGALPELAGPDAILVDPYDARSIARGLQDLVSLAESDTPERMQARRDFAAHLSRDRYLAHLQEVVDAACRKPNLPRPARQSSGRLWSVVPPPKPVLVGAAKAARKRIHVERLLESRKDPIDADSHSIDYLYGIQSEARARVLEDTAAVGSASWREKLPLTVRLARRMVRLIQTNILVRSMLNEALAKRLTELRK